MLLFQDMQHCWDRIRRSFSLGITSRRRGKDSNQLIVIGIERLRKSHQICKSFYIIPSLIESLFGINFCAVKENIVHQSKRSCIIHFWSAEAMKKVFTFCNETISTVQIREFTYNLCAKIHFKNH